MADSYVPIHTHHGEGKDTGEHVIVIDRQDHFAEQLPKGPGGHEVLCTLKGQRAGGQGISQGQVEDVDVCGCLHLGVPAEMT